MGEGMRASVTRSVAIFLFGLIPIGPACAAPAIAYVEDLNLGLSARADANRIDVYAKGEKLSRPSALLGSLAVASDGKQTTQNLVEAAKKRAADLGADFVLIVNETTRTKVHSDPTFASAIPILGGAVSVAHAGDVDVQQIPAMVFAVGAYNKSVLGVQWDREALKQQRFVVADFSSYSPMPGAGFRTGDEITEISGMSPGDKRVRKLLAVSPPGTALKMYVKRGAEHLSIEVATVPAP